MDRLKLLIIEDDPDQRELIREVVEERFGTGTVVGVDSRKAAVAQDLATFDLILCDWEMPEMSGLELLTWCRGQDSLKTTPFIMVTSRGDKENVVQAIQAGVSDYIGKPFSNEQLVTKVKKALSRAEERELQDAPEAIDRAESRVSALEHELADPNTYSQRGAEVPRLLTELEEALAAIDAPKRDVFVLFEIAELTMHEVALTVGCPLKTAYKRLYAARREIADKLGDKGRAR